MGGEETEAAGEDEGGRERKETEGDAMGCSAGATESVFTRRREEERRRQRSRWRRVGGGGRISRTGRRGEVGEAGGWVGGRRLEGKGKGKGEGGGARGRSGEVERERE